MSTICAEQHKLHPFHHLPFSKRLPFKDLDIPPRKQLLFSKKTHQEITSQDMSPYETTNLKSYLPCDDGVMGNNEVLDDNDKDDNLDPCASDHFRMYEFKVRRCTRSRSHDWTDCPFAHPGEKARRRDLRRYHYSGAVCPEFRRGGCGRGDSCGFAHGIFECWLHPARYRTEACKDGKNCKRKVCFFAHTSRQLRIPADALCGARKYDKSCLVSSPCRNSLNQGRCCCLVCRYKDVLTELISSLEAMKFNEAAVSSPMPEPMNGRNNINSRWIDTAFGADQLQFILSPSTQSPSGSRSSLDGDFSRKVLNLNEKMLNENGISNGGFSSPDPDLGWVNDLLT